MTNNEFLARIEHLFTTRGGALYGGEAVTQLEHGLQAALLAEKAGDDPALISAALLHDVGHLLHGHGDDCAEQGIDDNHEELGVRFIVKHFGPAVTEPVRLHVQAKRYLCQADVGYRAALSPPSQLSLRLQGGPMTDAEATEFQANPHFVSAIALRHYDDEAKVVGMPTPSYIHFAKYLEASLANS